MRLINTVSLKPEEFFETNIPKYVILSHTWAEGEISYKDFVKNRNLDAAGWTKIRNCCKFAYNRGHNYVWIDTCCIDKRSSAELSEAINSMYRWYQDAEECYAYLSDVSYGEGLKREDEKGREDAREAKREYEREYETYAESEYDRYNEEEDKSEDENENDVEIPPDHEFEDANEELIDVNGEESHRLREHVKRAFCASKWFTRGWTLQELLAPDHVYFVDRSWVKVLGDKKALSTLIAKITRIDEYVLTEDFWSRNRWRQSCSVAKRMSWASRRVCTRGEDVAYSLMGIFKVNMPLLYGEGKAVAFRRLQLEIMKTSTDESIFAWESYSLQSVSACLQYGGVLARSPNDFRFSANIQPFSPKQWAARQPYYHTNRGLAFQTVLKRLTLPQMNQILNIRQRTISGIFKGIYLLPLRCWDSDTSHNEEMKPMAILVKYTGLQDYARVIRNQTEGQKLENCPDNFFGVSHITGSRFVGEEELIFLQM